MPSTNGHPLIARGPLVAWDRELQARLAVAEEEGELTRMRAETAAHDRYQAPQEQVSPSSTPALEVALSYDAVPLNGHASTTELDLLRQERALLLARLEQQAVLITQLNAELESLRRVVALARGVMVDLISSRGYAVMRLFGRWKTLDKGIQRALR
jgi:hypothetical protein